MIDVKPLWSDGSSGVRRGTDVLKALAIGADAVSIGRLYLYGLAAVGEAGVTRALKILHEELARDMALLGVPSIADIDGRYAQNSKVEPTGFAP